MRQGYRALLKLTVVLSALFLLLPSTSRADFSWFGAHFDPAGSGPDNSYNMSQTWGISYELYISGAVLNDSINWSWYHPVIDPNTGLSTGAMEFHGLTSSSWTYRGDYWFFLAWPAYDYWYTSSDSLWLSTGLYINGYSATHYPGKWRIDVTRTSGGVETPLTSGYFTLIDDIKPTATFVSPTNGATLDGRQEITILAYDNVKVTSVDLYAKNKETGNMYFLNTISSVGRDGYWHYTWSSGSYPLGNYILIAQSNDPYGNTGEKSIDVMSYPEVAVVGMSAANDIDLPGVTDPVFTAQFVSSGSGASLINVENEPISALINSSFDLNVTVGAYPGRPTCTPVIEWKYSLLGNSNSGSFTGWSGTIPILTAVSRVSDRTFQDKDLKLTFIIKDPNTGQTIKRQTESLIFKPAKPEIKLEKIGETNIEKANNYSENTTIRLTTVYPAGHPLAGQMYIAGYDVMVAISESNDGVGALSFYDAVSGVLIANNTLNISNGYSDIIGKSLLKSDGATMPTKSLVTSLSHKVYGGQLLEISQWVDISPTNGIVDWFEQRVQNIGIRDCTSFDDDLGPYASAAVEVKKTHVSFNLLTPPYRLDESARAYFEGNEYTAANWLTSTVIHESRHCWQNTLILRSDIGTDNEFDLLEDPDNDVDPRLIGDGDFLPEVVTRADAYRILDDPTNKSINPNGFKGDSVPDDPYNAGTTTDPQTARETDAYSYAPHTSGWPLP